MDAHDIKPNVDSIHEPEIHGHTSDTCTENLYGN